MTITVIVPTFQGAHYLNKYSLPSLIRQDFSNWEAIVVDDASSDNTEEIVRSWQKKDSRIKYWRHESNRGLAAALNTGLERSQGEIITFLEQDDIWLNQKLSQQVKSLETAQFSDCLFFLFNEKQTRLSGVKGGNFSTLAGHRQSIMRLFPLPEDKKFLGIEDGLLAGRLALLTDTQILNSTDIHHSQEILVIVTRHNSSLSGHGRSLEYAARYQAALDYFQDNNSPGLSELKRSWANRRQLNLLLSNFPQPIQKALRWVKDLPGFAELLKWRKIKKSPAYLAARNIVDKLK